MENEERRALLLMEMVVGVGALLSFTQKGLRLNGEPPRRSKKRRQDSLVLRDVVEKREESVG